MSDDGTLSSDDHLHLHVSIDVSKVLEQVATIRAIEEMSFLKDDRSEFCRGWNACLKAVAARFAEAGQATDVLMSDSAGIAQSVSQVLSHDGAG
jgi:hypothetical protein